MGWAAGADLRRRELCGPGHGEPADVDWVPELITHSREQCETLAATIATAPGRREEIRRKLARNRGTALLFDTTRFASGIESAYAAMHEWHRAGLPPDHIWVPRNIVTQPQFARDA